MLRNGVSWLGFRLLITVRALLAPSVLGAAGLVFDGAGAVLLVRHSYKSGWSLPGGGVERGEPPHAAVLRELGEEVGLTGGTAELFALYSRRAGWATNVVALYRVTGGTIAFQPNREIREILWADPHNPPAGATPATLRRLAELNGAAIGAYW